MKYSNKRQRQAGFTIVEAAVTVVVSGIFILAIGTLYVSVTQSFTLTRNHATANDLAYYYLRKYASAGNTPTWFTCSKVSGSGNTNDLTINPNATGQQLEGGNLTTAATTLPSPVTYTVKALAIYGCSGSNLNKPVRVTATVTYGPSSTVTTHSTLVGY